MPSLFNLQQKWPDPERDWLRKTAKELMVNETELLLALVRREGHGEEGVGKPIEDYLPTPSPRSKRFEAMKRARKASESGP